MLAAVHQRVPIPHHWAANAPVRVLRSAITATGADAEKPRVIGEEDGRPIQLFSTDSPLRSMTGDYASMALYAGTGVGAIKSIVPTDVRLGNFLAQAAEAIPKLALYTSWMVPTQRVVAQRA